MTERDTAGGRVSSNASIPQGNAMRKALLAIEHAAVAGESARDIVEEVVVHVEAALGKPGDPRRGDGIVEPRSGSDQAMAAVIRERDTAERQRDEARAALNKRPTLEAEIRKMAEHHLLVTREGAVRAANEPDREECRVIIARTARDRLFAEKLTALLETAPCASAPESTIASPAVIPAGLKASVSEKVDPLLGLDVPADCICDRAIDLGGFVQPGKYNAACSYHGHLIAPRTSEASICPVHPCIVLGPHTDHRDEDGLALPRPGLRTGDASPDPRRDSYQADISEGEVHRLRADRDKWLTWAADNQQLHERASKASYERGLAEGRRTADDPRDVVVRAARVMHDAFLKIGHDTLAKTMNGQWVRLHAALDLLDRERAPTYVAHNGEVRPIPQQDPFGVPNRGFDANEVAHAARNASLAPSVCTVCGCNSFRSNERNELKDGEVQVYWTCIRCGVDASPAASLSSCAAPDPREIVKMIRDERDKVQKLLDDPEWSRSKEPRYSIGARDALDEMADQVEEWLRSDQFTSDVRPVKP
jgi:hypothetical protein